MVSITQSSQLHRGSKTRYKTHLPTRWIPANASRNTKALQTQTPTLETSRAQTIAETVTKRQDKCFIINTRLQFPQDWWRTTHQISTEGFKLRGIHRPSCTSIEGSVVINAPLFSTCQEPTWKIEPVIADVQVENLFLIGMFKLCKKTLGDSGKVLCDWRGFNYT